MTFRGVRFPSAIIGGYMENKLEVLAVLLTNRCNLKCVYCGRNENKDNFCSMFELTADEWIDIFKDAKTVGLKKVNMTGGEIFCRKDVLEIIERTIDLGLDVSIETNGTIITEEQIKYLSKLKDHLSMSISLDGIKKRTNDLTRGNGSFNRTFKTINIIRKYGIPLRIITVLSKNNYDEIPELATTIHEKLGLGFRLLPNIIEYGKGIEANETESVSYDKIDKLMNNFYYEFLRKHKEDKNLSIELNTAIIPVDIYQHSLCPWGKGMLGIGYSGKVALCHVGSDNDLFIFDDVKKTPISKIWLTNDKLKKFKKFDSNKLKGVCGNCLARSVCRGGCRLHSMMKYNGDLYAPDPECQNVYNLGKFPEYAMEDENKDCSYTE